MSLGAFYKKQITVARVYGIPVRIDYRWFIVVGLSVWLIARNLQTDIIQLGGFQLHPLAPATAWLLGIITTAGLFISVFGHELSHALMARFEGIEIEEIVLHPFGGLARLRKEPESPRAEFRIAIAGPAASFLFAAVLIIFGVYMIVAPNFRSYFMGLWSVLVGLFLFDAAYGVVKHNRARVQHVVSEAMSAPFSIEPDLSISQLIDAVLPIHRQVAFPVARDRQLHGILSLEDLKSLPRERWHLTKAMDVMRPIAPRFFVQPDTTLAHARELMKRNGVGSLAVVGKNGELVGFLQNGTFKKKRK